MRSVVVVFPASMWAMMPMFRMRSSGVVRGIALPLLSKNAGRPWRPFGPVSLRHHPGRGAACCAPTTWDAGSLGPGSRSCLSKRLPPVMRESPIGLRHPVRVLFLLDRLALALRREDQLGGEALRHVLLAPGAAERDQPAHPQRRASLGPHFHRDLVGGAAHTARDRKSTRLNSSH